MLLEMKKGEIHHGRYEQLETYQSIRSWWWRKFRWRSSGGEFHAVSNPFVSLQFYNIDVAGLETCSVSTNGTMAQFSDWLYPEGLTFTVPANKERDFYMLGTLKSELAAKGKIFHKAYLRCTDQSNVKYEFELDIVQIDDAIETIGGSHKFEEEKTFTVSEIIFDGTPWFLT